MHEYSIASGIWASVAKAARARGAGGVASINLEIGALSLIEEEQLRFWIEALAEREGSPGVRVVIRHLPASVKCNDCQTEGEPELPAGALDHFALPPLACAKCGSREVTIMGGREIRVVSAEVREERSGG